MPSLICPNCKYQAKKNEVFCSKCGTKLEHLHVQKTSNACEKELQSGDDFCTQSASKHKAKKGVSCALIIGLAIATAVTGINKRARQSIAPVYSDPVERAQKIEELLPKAESGDVNAQFQLGRVYEGGGLGFNGYTIDKNGNRVSNLSEALKWYRKAAEQGHKGAKEALYRIPLQ